MSVLAIASGCTRADCVTVDCRPLGDGGGSDAADAGPPPDAFADGAPTDAGMCGMWASVGTCEAPGCPAPDEVTLGLAHVASVGDAALPAPESIAMVPGEARAIVVSAVGNRVAEVFYDGEEPRIGRAVVVEASIATQYLTGVVVHPSRRWAAVGVADADCASGEVVFVDLGASFGQELHRVEVGFGPDGLAISRDGRWIVTADEDQRSNRPCKPDDRHGGTVTVLEVGASPSDARVAQTIAVDHARDSEPESVGIGAAGTVAVTLQETSELLVFSLGDVPDAEPTIHGLPSGGEPDGVAVHDGLGIAVVGLEHSDDAVSVDLTTGETRDVVDLVASGDVPADYNRDQGDADEVHEPEHVALVPYRGATFAVFPLQESHAVMAYRLDDAGGLTLDSAAPTGFGWMEELGGTDRSDIGPEGIAVDAAAGLAIVANEREGSVTLLRAEAAHYEACD